MQEEKEASAAIVLTPPQGSQALSTLSPAVQERVDHYKTKPRTASTLRAYKNDWVRFYEWCKKGGHSPLPAEEDVVVAYLLELSQWMKPASIERAYAAIRVLHNLKGIPLPKQPGVYNAFSRIRRERAAAGLPNVIKKRALESEQIIEAASQLPDTLTGLRDRVVLLFGWIIGQRRAEIAAVEVGDLTSTDDGLDVLIRRSKTDQEGKGFVVAVAREGGPGCPVEAVRAWLKMSGVREGALIRRIHKSGSVDPRGLSPDGIAQIVKAAARRLGLDPKDYGGHSLRRGFVTSADKAGKSMGEIMSITGHTDEKTARGYIDTSTRIKRAAGRGLLATPKSIADHLDPELLFYKGTQAVTLGWVRKQVRLLESRGLSREKVIEALVKVGLTKDGRSIEGGDL